MPGISIDVWIAGSHNVLSMIGDSRMFCNPRVYGSENAESFNPSLIVEV